MQRFILGVDIGGTHVTAAVVELSAQALLPHTVCRAGVNAGGTVEEVIEAWSNVMQEAIRKAGADVQSVGIAMPGPFDYKQGVALMKNQGKYDALFGLNIRILLAQQLQVPESNILFRNDAACFLQGEVFCGAAKGCDRAIGLTLGTGLGSTWYRDGVAEDADRWNTPFKDGIAEEYLSSRWFVKRFQEMTGQQLLNVKAIADLYSVEPKVQQLFDEFGYNLGAFLVSFVHDEQPEVIILGGNIAHALPLFERTLVQTLQQQNIELPVYKTQLGEEAALVGAASLWNKPEPMHLI